MRNSDREREPLCETSEPGEKLFTKRELLPISLDVGRRILEVFGSQSISHIVFRLKSTPREINAVIDGRSLPSAELLLGIQKLTGVSIDWVLTGAGSKFPQALPLPGPVHEPAPIPTWFVPHENEQGLPLY